ncbi:hypothetical protein TNCV_3888751 [Trichonephila clavipes]|nr:hypothetical protein TNCV_3888751 [Trichonephila clavipes]
MVADEANGCMSAFLTMWRSSRRLVCQERSEPVLIYFYLSNARTWLLDHLTPSLQVQTDDAVSRVFIKSSELEQVVAIHSGMTADWVGLEERWSKVGE